MGFTIYAPVTGKTVGEVPESHIFAEHVIDRLEGAGKHVAGLVYDHSACADCGKEGVPLSLQMLAPMGELSRQGLAMLCEGCHSSGEVS